jgi:hypothetical protein
MSGVVSWDPKTVAEIVVRYADFTDELATGEALAGAIVTTATVWSGNDPNPQNIVTLTAVLSNYAGVNAVAAVTLSAGVLGTVYQCVVTSQTSAGRNLTKTASFAIKPHLN